MSNRTNIRSSARVALVAILIAVSVFSLPAAGMQEEATDDVVHVYSHRHYDTDRDRKSVV